MKIAPIARTRRWISQRMNKLPAVEFRQFLKKTSGRETSAALDPRLSWVQAALAVLEAEGVPAGVGGPAAVYG